MTREEDKGLYEEDSRNQKAQDMQCRIAMIKKYRPVLCISGSSEQLSGDSSVCGPQVFYYEDSAGERIWQSLYQEELNLGLKVKTPSCGKKVIKPIIC